MFMESTHAMYYRIFDKQLQIVFEKYRILFLWRGMNEWDKWVLVTFEPI